MKNSIKFLMLCSLALGLTIFTSCGSDDDLPPIDPTLCDSLQVQINETNDSLNIVLTAETFGYTGTLIYLWSNGETGASISHDLDDEGTYSVTVTADGVDNCEATGSIDLTNEAVDCSDFSVLIIDTLDLATLSANASGGTAPYTYLWTTGETTPTIDVTEAGTYGVSITDANGCAAGATYDYEPTNNIDCSNFGANYTQIDTAGVVLLHATPFGGTAPYTYEWSTNQTTSWDFIEVTTSGTYTVTITDANGCVTSGSFTVVFNTNPCDNYAVQLWYHPDSLQMGQDFLTANAIGGTFPNAYLWSTGETSHIIDVSGATGIYSVTATDSNGCTAEESYEF